MTLKQVFNKRPSFSSNTNYFKNTCDIFTASKRSLRRFCFYTCLSVILFTGGVCLSACWDTPPGADPPRADTPRADPLPEADTPRSRHPPGADPPPEQTPSQKQTPPEADTLQEQIPPHRLTSPRSRPSPPRSRSLPAQCILGDTGNKRAVRILLECILVGC